MQHETRGGAQRTNEDHEELGRFLEEAERSLEAGNLCEAKEALKKACLKAATMWVGQSTLSGPTRDLVYLVGEVQEQLLRPEPLGPPGSLLENLIGLRSRFEAEARKDAKGATANETGALPR